MLHKATDMFRDVELICKGHTVPRDDWENLVLAVTVEGRPFNFGTFSLSPATKVEDLFPALVGDSELTALDLVSSLVERIYSFSSTFKFSW